MPRASIARQQHTSGWPPAHLVAAASVCLHISLSAALECAEAAKRPSSFSCQTGASTLARISPTKPLSNREGATFDAAAACGFMGLVASPWGRVSNAWPERPCELRFSTAVARADALFNRDAVSPLNCVITLLANSSAMTACVRDATVQAPFAAEVEWKVRPKSRKPRKTSALDPLLVAVRFEATASCQRFGEFAFSFLFS